ncbi:Na+/H+ antiporter NhaA [Humisphaera borealis]|uniref:Na(+)/H(+) antiporter NhaA n=1 Tax=Humisphaera borealis TaxID=2807512 RepID=A0A7M2WXV3_9BACT|nr:Na+/H+ antiporter NhaA [Humisphaera borealis]QOV89631.1 Na+/H+ antiporter NhaA [Humisphaera borealis]
MVENNPHDESGSFLPPRPIDRIISPVSRFMHVEAMGGVVLLISAIVAIALANSPVSKDFLGFWKTPVGLQIGTFEFRHPLYHLINDGLMAIFFFVVGLEVKREIVHGELRGIRQAALPLAAALGGMIVPAGVFLLLQGSDPQARRGWGIPMATDIAFVVGCMAVLGRRVPHGLRVLLLSLAIADDIGAILVIAVGYTASLSMGWLAIGLAGFVLVFLMGRLGIRSFAVYTVVGTFIWFAFHESGVHATIAGVILGLMTPANRALGTEGAKRFLDRIASTLKRNDWNDEGKTVGRIRSRYTVAREMVSPLSFLLHVLHPWVSFVIMPVFALANAGVPFSPEDLGKPIAVAIMAGLFLGKPVGIAAVSYLAVKLRIAQLPSGVSWLQIVGGGVLAGIGFTMALFIAGLAVQGQLLSEAKVGVLAASAASAAVGMIILYVAHARNPQSAATAVGPGH